MYTVDKMYDKFVLAKKQTIKPALANTCTERKRVYGEHIFVTLEKCFPLKHVFPWPPSVIFMDRILSQR